MVRGERVCACTARVSVRRDAVCVRSLRSRADFGDLPTIGLYDEWSPGMRRSMDICIKIIDILLMLSNGEVRCGCVLRLCVCRWEAGSVGRLGGSGRSVRWSGQRVPRPAPVVRRGRSDRSQLYVFPSTPRVSAFCCISLCYAFEFAEVRQI
jgi:hypothetical protein